MVKNDIEFEKLMISVLDFSNKKYYDKTKLIYKCESTKYNEFLLKMGYIGYVYIKNEEPSSILKEFLECDDQILVNGESSLQIKLRFGQHFLGLIHTSKQG
jgi:hypothetical protein